MGIGQRIGVSASRLRDRAVAAIGGVTRAEASKRATEAHAQGYDDGNDETPPGSTGLRSYRYRATGTSTARDIAAGDIEKVTETAWNLSRSNPLADRALEIKRDYILGRGVDPKTDDPDLQKIIDDFWSGNRLNRRMREFTRQLFLFGTQCYAVFVRKADGRIRLGYFDPSEIEEVLPHPENAMEMWAVVIKEVNQAVDKPWVKRHGKRVYRIVREEDGTGIITDSPTGPFLFGKTRQAHTGKLVVAAQAKLEEWEYAMLKTYGLESYSGSCIYEKVNAVSNQSRGLSDLVQAADFADQYDSILFAMGDREQFAGYFNWDVTLEGLDEAGVAKRAAQIKANPPEKGSINVHNEKETWRFDYPDLKTAATVEAANAFQALITGGLGFPLHWFGRGDETNRATAQAQNDPTWRTLEHDQDIVREMILTMLTLVRDQAEIAGHWKPKGTEETVVAVTMPEMTSKDVVSISSALSALAGAMMVAQDQGWMTVQEGRETWAKVMAELDVQIETQGEAAQVPGEIGGIETMPGSEALASWFANHAPFEADVLAETALGAFAESLRANGGWSEQTLTAALERIGA